MIPKIIFQISDIEPLNIKQFKTFSSNQWVYLHFNNNQAIQFFNDNPTEEFENIIDIFNNIDNKVHKCNLFIYYVMYIMGGVYICSTGMLEANIETITQNYSFFCINSCGRPNSIFRGFMGATAKHTIIYNTLLCFYKINDLNQLDLDEKLYEIILNSKYNIKLYQERYENNSFIGKTINDNNQIIFSNYWNTKIIPFLSDNIFMNEKFNILDDKYEFQNTVFYSRIPRILHIIWLNSNTNPIRRPNYVDENIGKWKDIMPDWEIKVWTENNINDLPLNALEQIQKAEKGAQKADIARYFIIEKYGGLYVDTDVIPYRNLEPLLSFENSELILCHDIPVSWTYISIGFFGAIPHHPVLKTACEMAKIAELNTCDIHMKTGPRLFGQAVYDTQITNQKYLLLPSKYFYHNNDYTLRFGNHFYAKEW